MFPIGTKYTELFKVITPRFFIHHEIHSKITVSTLKYGDYNIITTLQSPSTWSIFNNISTYHEASINFLKYVNIGVTLQYTANKIVASALMNVNLTKEKMIILQQNVENNINTNNLNKCNPNGQMKGTTDRYKRYVFPAFDLSTNIIGLGNGFGGVITVTYEIKYDPENFTLLKYLFIKSPVLNPISPSDSNIHFIPHGLIQSTYTTTVKQKIQQNCFFTQTKIIPIFKIPETTMNLDLKTHLLAIPSIIGLKSRYITECSGKLLAVVKKLQKD